jgi:hypothetical protein
MSCAIYSIPIERVFLRDARALQVKYAAAGRASSGCGSLHLVLERSAVTWADVTGLP